MCSVCAVFVYVCVVFVCVVQYLQICSGVSTPPFVVMFLPLLNYISARLIVHPYVHFLGGVCTGVMCYV